MKMGPHGSRPSCVQTRTARMNAKAAKVAKGAAPAAHLIATLALTRGGQLCDLRGLCVHRRGCDRSLTRPWGEQSDAFSEQDAEDLSSASSVVSSRKPGAQSLTHDSHAD